MKSANKGLYLSIPTPCTENWDEMNSREQGKFCTRCNKNLIDFSLMTDSEIIAAIRQSSGSICGSFAETQLNRVVAGPDVRHGGLLPIAIITAMLAVTFTESQAGIRKLEQLTIVQHPEIQRKDSVILRQKLPEIVVVGYIPSKRVTGVVCIKDVPKMPKSTDLINATKQQLIKTRPN